MLPKPKCAIIRASKVYAERRTQLWQRHRRSYYQKMNFTSSRPPNGKVLEVKNFNTENGAAIRLWDYAGHPWQQWKFVDAGEGRWRIQNRFTGKMMDLALGGVVEGTWLHQWGRTSGLSQCWALEPTRNGRTRIRNVLADKVHRPCGHEHLQRCAGADPGTSSRAAIGSGTSSVWTPPSSRPGPRPKRPMIRSRRPPSANIRTTSSAS